MASTPRRWRQLAVWLQIVTSTGWLTLALTLFVLLSLAATTRDRLTATAATAMADHLDTVLLAPLANASAATGLVLSVSTAWGLTHHRWVLAKFAISLVQLYVGIFLLAGALDATAGATRLGTGGPSPALLAGTALMASAIAFQVWLSVAKPGGRTRWARDRGTAGAVKLPTAAGWVFAAAVLGPVADIAVGTVVGYPAPVLSLMVLVAAVTVRHRTLRASARRGSPVRAPLPARRPTAR